jgi:SAM domain (Sterile alpha motif)
MDVVVWLRSLGLGKYEAAFRENEIDETVLPSLTESSTTWPSPPFAPDQRRSSNSSSSSRPTSYTLVLPRHSKASSRRFPKTSQSWWRVTARN